MLTHTAACLGELSLAAHQIGLTLFFFLTPFLEVISQTGQAFLPAFEPPRPAVTSGAEDHSSDAGEDGIDAAAAADATDAEDADAKDMGGGGGGGDDDASSVVAVWREASDALATRLLRYALVVSSGCALVGAAIPLAGTGFLTNDAAVRLAVRPLALPLAASALLCGPIGAAEGILLARRQLKFLAGTYLATIALLPPALLAVKASPFGSVGLIWTCFAVFQLFRATAFSARVGSPPRAQSEWAPPRRRAQGLQS